MQTAAREEILASGGSLSHHHGQGQRWHIKSGGAKYVHILRVPGSQLHLTSFNTDRKL